MVWLEKYTVNAVHYSKEWRSMYTIYCEICNQIKNHSDAQFFAYMVTHLKKQIGPHTHHATSHSLWAFTRNIISFSRISSKFYLTCTCDFPTISNVFYFQVDSDSFRVHAHFLKSPWMSTESIAFRNVFTPFGN